MLALTKLLSFIQITLVRNNDNDYKFENESTSYTIEMSTNIVMICSLIKDWKKNCVCKTATESWKTEFKKVGVPLETDVAKYQVNRKPTDTSLALIYQACDQDRALHPRSCGIKW